MNCGRGFLPEVKSCLIRNVKVLAAKLVPGERGKLESWITRMKPHSLLLTAAFLETWYKHSSHTFRQRWWSMQWDTKSRQVNNQRSVTPGLKSWSRKVRQWEAPQCLETERPKQKWGGGCKCWPAVVVACKGLLDVCEVQVPCHTP